MLAALLRHRKVVPAFLDPNGSFAARSLLNVLKESSTRNEDFAKRKRKLAARSSGQVKRSNLAAERRFKGNSDIIVELIAFIHLEGRDPNIIRRIDAIEDED